MPNEYQKDGDLGFVGLNSRDNPISLSAGIVNQSQNFRMDRGVATVRKGMQRKTIGDLIGQTVYGVGTYLNSTGQEIIVCVVANGLFTYNPQTEVLSTKIYFPNSVTGKTLTSSDSLIVTVTSAAHGLLAGASVYVECSSVGYTGLFVISSITTNTFTYTMPSVASAGAVSGVACRYNAVELITTQDGCDVVAGTDLVIISRGFSKRPLVWDFTTSITAMPAHGTGHEFPSCESILYYANRFIVTGRHHGDSVLRNNDTVSVSNFLDYQHFDALDAFTINNGSNDRIVGVAPWTLNEFLVFMRNSIFYVGVGTSRYVSGEPLSNDSYVRTLATDIGCSSKKSVVQANGGVLFLSDNGVYFLQPQQSSAESMKLLTMADPISASIDDVIQRINKTYAYRAVATYWNNRYYLAVPLDASVDNNAILVYNFILRQWESVDTYPVGFDIFDFVIAKKDNQRRMYGVDTDQGIFLMEQLNWDEYGDAIGEPILPFFIPATLGEAVFTPNVINAVLKTRRYSFNGIGDKRFSTAETEIVSDAGSQVETVAEVFNPDTLSVIDNFSAELTEDSARRATIRKIGTGIQLRYTSTNLRPSIRSAYVYATIQKQTNTSKT